jgi:hypothetical protein
MIVINFVLVVIWMMGDNDVTTPDFGDNIERMFLFADASVWEEIISRVLFIGVPMMIISFIVTQKKESLRCLLGGFGMSTTALVLIFISGAIFGIAHYSGWDNQEWKVIATAIMGIFMGYVFVRFGLYAAILMHFITDYLSAFDWMGIGDATIWISLVMLITGFFALLYIIYRLAKSGGTLRSMPAFKNGFIKDQ